MPTIDTSGYVSEFTKKTLEQFGWKPGDPLLENVGALIQEIRDRIPATKKPGIVIDIELMTPEDIDLIKAALAAAKKEKEKEEKEKGLAAEMSKLAPGVQEAYAKLAQLENSSGETQASENDIQIFDDRSKTDTKPAAPEAAKKPEEQSEPVEIPKPKKPDLSAEAGVAQPDLLAAKPAAFCPRCDWDMRRTYDVDITPVDKENFLVTVLSGERFKKDYTLLNGKYTIIFRTLLAEENKKIHRQLVLEQRANEFFSDTEWFLRFFEYRLACSVESIIVNDKVLALVPTLEEVEGTPLPAKFDDPSLPSIIRMHKYVIQELLSAEVTRRLVSKQFREFQRLYEALEAMALEPNFW